MKISIYLYITFTVGFTLWIFNRSVILYNRRPVTVTGLQLYKITLGSDKKQRTMTIGTMQRIFSAARTFSSLMNLQSNMSIQQSLFSTLQKPAVNERWLVPFNPLVNFCCGFKVKGYVRRRCKSCYIVIRDERIYNICPKYPRHKQMSMKPKPHNTWILTHATQSRVRPW